MAFRPFTRAAAQGWARRCPVVHASRVISWAERRASWVHRLFISGGGGFKGELEDFSPEDLGKLVVVVGSSLAEIRVDWDLDEQEEQYVGRFWESLRDSVAPHRRLRSLVVQGVFADVFESEVEPLGQQIAGSLEELVLSPRDIDGLSYLNQDSPFGPPRFPESFCALTELRRIKLSHL